jgi:hypothetical protein
LVDAGDASGWRAMSQALADPDARQVVAGPAETGTENFPWMPWRRATRRCSTASLRRQGFNEGCYLSPLEKGKGILKIKNILEVIAYIKSGQGSLKRQNRSN